MMTWVQSWKAKRTRALAAQELFQPPPSSLLEPGATPIQGTAWGFSGR